MQSKLLQNDNGNGLQVQSIPNRVLIILCSVCNARTEITEWPINVDLNENTDFNVIFFSFPRRPCATKGSRRLEFRVHVVFTYCRNQRKSERSHAVEFRKNGDVNGIHERSKSRRVGTSRADCNGYRLGYWNGHRNRTDRARTWRSGCAEKRLAILIRLRTYSGSVLSCRRSLTGRYDTSLRYRIPLPTYSFRIFAVVRFVHRAFNVQHRDMCVWRVRQQALQGAHAHEKPSSKC